MWKLKHEMTIIRCIRLRLLPEKNKNQSYAADGYIRKLNIDKESRFDIITVIKKSEDFEIDHIETAFYPTLR